MNPSNTATIGTKSAGPDYSIPSLISKIDPAGLGPSRSIPTATYVGYIEDLTDALYIFEATQSGLLPRTTRRLNAMEKERAVYHGAIHVFLERESGIKRWTDKLNWSASRITGHFLMYREIIPSTPPPQPLDDGKPCPMARKSGFAIKSSGLVKRTVSLEYRGIIHHLVSYYDETLLNNLPRPRFDPRIQSLTICPEIKPFMKKNAIPLHQNKVNLNTLDPSATLVRKRFTSTVQRHSKRGRDLNNPPTPSLSPHPLPPPPATAALDVSSASIYRTAGPGRMPPPIVSGLFATTILPAQINRPNWPLFKSPLLDTGLATPATTDTPPAGATSSGSPSHTQLSGDQSLGSCILQPTAHPAVPSLPLLDDSSSPFDVSNWLTTVPSGLTATEFLKDSGFFLSNNV